MDDIIDENTDIEQILRENQEKNRREMEERRKRFGFLPLSEEYAPVMAANMEDVEANPKKFIMTECLDACSILWSKNVYTFMVSDWNNDEAWIEVFMDGLSEENKNYILSLSDKGIHLFEYHPGTVCIGVGCFGEQARQLLIEIANGFQMQDVYQGYGYLDVETALSRVGCTKTEKNPDYIFMELPGDDASTDEYLAYYEWVGNGGENQEFIQVFDQSKVKEPLDMNFEGTDFIYVPEEDRVYLSKYHYDKHLKYLQYCGEHGIKQISV